jgi:hypothetical protein
MTRIPLECYSMSFKVACEALLGVNQPYPHEGGAYIDDDEEKKISKPTMLEAVTSVMKRPELLH